MIPLHRNNAALAKNTAETIRSTLTNYLNSSQAMAIHVEFKSMIESLMYALDFEGTIDKAIQGKDQQKEIDNISHHLVGVLEESIGLRLPANLDEIRDVFTSGFARTIHTTICLEQHDGNIFQNPDLPEEPTAL
jgi:hypothetical protein